MSTIEVAVAGRGIQVKQGYEKPSAGDVNTCAVSLAIESGGVWDGLPHKRVTFSTRTASVTVDYAPTIAIPHEVMASPGALYLTLTGYDADGIEVARTHRMTYPIEVARAGADEGAEPTPATLDVVSRIDNLASTLEQSETTRQEAFESAQNERSSAFEASMSEWQQDVAESVSQVSTVIETANDAATNANNAASAATGATENANEAAAGANDAAASANNAANELREAAERGDFDGKPGEPGAPGAPGEPGADGYSPTASVTKNGGTATITITDKNGTTTATVSDGAKGDPFTYADFTEAQILELQRPATDAAADAQTAIADVKATEAKLYPAAENVLVGSETGAVVHVDDAFAGASLRKITVEGACRQDGTPSPDNPVPIQVIENPVVKVAGVDTSTVTTSIAFTLPAEHPYLAKLPDGTADEITVDIDGNVELVARVQKYDTSHLGAANDVAPLDNGLNRYSYWNALQTPAKPNSPCMTPNFASVVDWSFPSQGCYMSSSTLWVGASADPTDTLRASGYLYCTIATPTRYPLGKIEMPKAQDSIVNVWTDAEITPNTGIEYVRDVNIVISNLESAIASITEG